MHPVNKLLSVAGLQLVRTAKKTPPGFISRYKHDLEVLKETSKDFLVFSQLEYDGGEHPEDNIDFQCVFAAANLKRTAPSSILDIGSYRIFILGMLSNYNVTTIDVRERKPALMNETVVTCDAKALAIPSGSFDSVVSLCALEHFGLGRYGDEFDPEGDKKAFKEMVRVLKPGGHLILTTTITRGQPSIAFNAHRIYSLAMMRDFSAGLDLVDSKYRSRTMARGCSFEEVTDAPGAWDTYCACWRKR